MNYSPKTACAALLVLVMCLLFSTPGYASRYEINYSGINLTLTGFIDLVDNPDGTYQGSQAFRTSVVDGYEIRVSGDLRGDFIFTPANSLIGNSSGGDLDWIVSNSGIAVVSPVVTGGSNGPPPSEIVRSFFGNEWLRLTSTFIDYRNNTNGGNQLTHYDTSSLPLAFNTFQPNGGPFVSTVVPLPGALLLLLPALGVIGFSVRRHP